MKAGGVGLVLEGEDAKRFWEDRKNPTVFKEQIEMFKEAKRIQLQYFKEELIMETKDIHESCWICRRTKKELNKPFEDAPDFKIPLREVADMINYSGYYICDVCRCIILSINTG